MRLGTVIREKDAPVKPWRYEQSGTLLKTLAYSCVRIKSPVNMVSLGDLTLPTVCIDCLVGLISYINSKLHSIISISSRYEKYLG